MIKTKKTYLFDARPTAPTFTDVYEVETEKLQAAVKAAEALSVLDLDVSELEELYDREREEAKGRI